MNPIVENYKIFSQSGGIFENKKGFLKVSGSDRVDFLHRLTSQDIKSLISGDGAKVALLQPTGTILNLFDIYNCGNFFLLVVDHEQTESLIQSLEKFHFAEEIEIKNVSEEFKFLSVQGKNSVSAIKKALGRVSTREKEIVGLEECLIVNYPDFSKGLHGFHLFAKTEEYPEVKARLGKEGLPILNLEFWDFLRAESAHFLFNKDISEKNIILEAPLIEYVARGKGCYPGQEVVERIFTYGTIAKKLMGLKFPAGAGVLEEKIKLISGIQDAGYLTSSHMIPWTEKVFGFGIVRKPYYVPGQKLKLENSDVEVEVVSLPNAFDIQKAKDSNQLQEGG